ncbi:MAG: hypothetical protein JWM09_346, partial [Francisellaceae bacterium]|nr:hypothetical protein [Francisellaceae bacterium]
MQDILSMSMLEIDRLEVIMKVVSGDLSQIEASRLLNLSPR